MTNEIDVRLDNSIQLQRSRITTDRMDVSFGELINMYDNNELIIRPEYQRFFRWDEEQRSALLESILLGIPIPPIFVAEDSEGIWEVVDGLQRLSTIISFFGKLRITEKKIKDINFWKLESCNLVKELEGLDFRTLPKKYLLNIKRAVCRIEILRGESNVAMKYELFKRLNSGGSQLKAQEIRNAIYRGYGSKVNNLIERLSANRIFVEYTNLTDRKKVELYDQELILRFLAFYNNTTGIDDNTAKFLDKFILSATLDENYDCSKYEKLFLRVMDVVAKLGDRVLFKTDGNNFVAAYFESIVVFVAENIDFYEIHLDVLREKVALLKTSDEFAVYMGSASNSKSRTVKRLEIAKKIFEVREYEN